MLHDYVTITWYVTAMTIIYDIILNSVTINILKIYQGDGQRV